MNCDVFICHRSEEPGGLFANWLYKELKDIGYLDIFYSPFTVNHGYNFLEPIDEVLKSTHVFILVLSPNFFRKCKQDNDVVKYEIKVAAQNPKITFFPVTLENFKYDNEDLSCFTSEEIGRFKHQAPIPFNGIYDTLFIPQIKKDILSLLEHGQCIEDLKKRNKNRYRGANEEKEKEFLRCQTNMLLEYDKIIYEKITFPGQIILDMGCNDGYNTMARFKNISNVKIIGIDRDSDCIQSANKNYSNDNIHFYCNDIENRTFNSFLNEIENKLNIECFDLVNLSMILLHTEKPYQLLKIIRSHINENSILFIRDIDDDFSLAYPDKDKIFHKMINICSYCDMLGSRNSGKEIYSHLKQNGFSKVSIEKISLNTSMMSYDEKEAIFNLYFGYLPVALEKTMESHPNNIRIQKDYNWVCENLDYANQKFHQSDFIFFVGYIIYTARI